MTTKATAEGKAPKTTKAVTQTVNVRGKVRDMVAQFVAASKATEPTAWAGADDRPSGRRVTVDKTSALEVANFLMEAREWARLAGTFKDQTQRANLLRDSFGIAKAFAVVAGVTLEQPERLRLREDKTVDLPTEAVDDLKPGDEVRVVRHVTRYGLDLVDQFGAVVKGRAKNGDYWLTSLADGTARACRPTEVVVVKRATADDATADTTAKKRTKK